MTQDRPPTEREIKLAQKMYKLQETGTLIKMVRAVMQDSFSIRPMNRVKARIAEFAPQRSLDGAQVEEAQPRSDYGFGFRERLGRFRFLQPQLEVDRLFADENKIIQDEKNAQLLEAAKKREVVDAAAKKKLEDEAALGRARDSMGVSIQ